LFLVDFEQLGQFSDLFGVNNTAIICMIALFSCWLPGFSCLDSHDGEQFELIL